MLTRLSPLSLAARLFTATLVAAPAAAIPPAEDPAPVPATGAIDVPTNPLILVKDNGVELRLIDDADVGVGLNVAEVAGHFVSLLRVTVAEPLHPNTRYRLLARNEGEGRELSSFTTGSGADDAAPGLPQLNDRGAFAGGRAALGIESDEPIEVVRVGSSEGTYFDFVDAGGISVLGEPDAVSPFSIVALDLPAMSRRRPASNSSWGRPANSASTMPCSRPDARAHRRAPQPRPLPWRCWRSSACLDVATAFATGDRRPESCVVVDVVAAAVAAVVGSAIADTPPLLVLHLPAEGFTTLDENSPTALGVSVNCLQVHRLAAMNSLPSSRAANWPPGLSHRIPDNKDSR